MGRSKTSECVSGIELAVPAVYGNYGGLTFPDQIFQSYGLRPIGPYNYGYLIY